MKKFTKSSINEDRKFMTRFGTSLATISFGINFNTQDRFFKHIRQRKFVNLLKIHGDQEKTVEIPKSPNIDLKSSIQIDHQISNYQESGCKLSF